MTLEDFINMAVAAIWDFKAFLSSLIDKFKGPVDTYSREDEIAYNDPNACALHGYFLEWRTCIHCDIIVQNGRNSVASFVDLGPEVSGAFHPNYANKGLKNRPTLQQKTEPDQHRPKAPVISNAYASEDDSYDSTTSDGRNDHSERSVLIQNDDTFSDEESMAELRWRRNRLQKKASNKTRTRIGDYEDDMEHLSLPNELPSTYRYEKLRRAANVNRCANGRHVSFAA
ncbi:2a480447-5c09-45e6-bfe8-d7c11bbb05d4 [Sclerotinia trifoliorum]|uniref:2a480447-5c09-45e6-bfe8-d7c11bbb05d4 n=1 Tax=Sclerotinia trifoliorum TaxID=28548 RepID=A0A8H2VQB1_9HELO|nr:2a480447-5c09-45e6-bfe8-d7c11bbb05d4 [Sclerotinia trifoliorum]